MVPGITTDGIANSVPKFGADFSRHTCGRTGGSKFPRLSTGDSHATRPFIDHDDLRDLCSLARFYICGDDGDLVRLAI